MKLKKKELLRMIKPRLIELGYTWFKESYISDCDCFCKKINKKDLKVGDLVFFATGKSSSKVSHVGLYIGNGEFIHASSSKGVIITDLNKNYYVRTFVSAGRVEGIKDKK